MKSFKHSSSAHGTSSLWNSIFFGATLILGILTAGGTVRAQSATLFDVLDKAIVFFPFLTVLVITIGFLVFFWGLAIFVLKAGDEEGRVEGRERMVWGILILFIFISLWGILRVLMDILDVDNQVSCPPPSISGGSVSSCI